MEFEKTFDHRPNKQELVVATVQMGGPSDTFNREIEIIKEKQDVDGKWHLRWKIKEA